MDPHDSRPASSEEEGTDLSSTDQRPSLSLVRRHLPESKRSHPPLTERILAHINTEKGLRLPGARLPCADSLTEGGCPGTDFYILQRMR